MITMTVHGTSIRHTLPTVEPPPILVVSLGKAKVPLRQSSATDNKVNRSGDLFAMTPDDAGLARHSHYES